MCILIAKSAASRKMTEREIINSASNNPDGFGMAWVNKKGKIRTLHTFFVEDVIKQNNKLSNDTPIIYHFRIATHGSVNLINCHPFLSADKSIAFGHNGVLSIKNENDKTDSETAFQRLFVPVIKAFGNGIGLDLAVNTIIGSSKFAFLFKDGSIKTYGGFVNDKGLLFSNKTYSYEAYYYGKYFDWDYPRGYIGATNTRPIASATQKPLEGFDDSIYEQEYVTAEKEMRLLMSKITVIDYNFLYDFISDNSLIYPSLEWEDYEDMFNSIQKKIQDVSCVQNTMCYE